MALRRGQGCWAGGGGAARREMLVNRDRTSYLVLCVLNRTERMFIETRVADISLEFIFVWSFGRISYFQLHRRHGSKYSVDDYVRIAP